MDQKARSQLHIPEQPLDFGRMMSFQMQLSGSFGGAMIAFAAYLGDTLGIFAHLAKSGPLDAEDIAGQLELDLPLVRVWLQLMSAAGFLTYDENIEAYALPPEYAAVIGRPTGPMCFAGGLQQLAAFAQQLPNLANAFRQGGGLAQASYSEDLWHGMERLSAMWFDHEMVDEWIPAIDGLKSTLKNGCSVADVGCGGGRALIRLAEAFSASRFHGLDQFSDSVDRAVRNAAKAKVADRVEFSVCDIESGIDAQYDVITAFDSLHDMRDPKKAIENIAAALKQDGTVLIYELADTDDRPHDEMALMDVMLHGVTLFYNLPVALSQNPDRQVTTVLKISDIRKYCRAAGLTVTQMLQTRNPLHLLLVAKKSAM